MTPRIPIQQCLRNLNISSPSPSPFRPFTTTTTLHARKPVSKKRRTHDPYLIAQTRARKAANVTRQEVLRKQRAEALGDPVRGIPTDFLRSFDTGQQGKDETPVANLNHSLEKKEVEEVLERSFNDTIPLETDAAKKADVRPSWDAISDPAASKERELTRDERHEIEHERARSAIERIVQLSNASSRDRLRVNIARCVASFGRHNTDKIFPAREVNPEAPKPTETKTPRVGPDTGSSEVQIAILTAKIRTLATELEQRGNNDKHNKRSLTLLVHKRQKLLKYFKRKDRGGPRWQNLVTKLGLTEGTWMGEITLANKKPELTKEEKEEKKKEKKRRRAMARA